VALSKWPQSRSARSRKRKMLFFGLCASVCLLINIVDSNRVALRLLVMTWPGAHVRAVSITPSVGRGYESLGCNPTLFQAVTQVCVYRVIQGQAECLAAACQYVSLGCHTGVCCYRVIKARLSSSCCISMRLLLTILGCHTGVYCYRVIQGQAEF